MKEFSNLSKITLLSFLLVACKEQVPSVEECLLPSEVSQNQKASKEGPDQSPRICRELTPSLEANIEVNAVLRDFSFEKEEKMQKALRRLKLVINSEEFKQKVLNHEYQGQKKFIDNQGLTNLEVYESLLRASETLLPGEDNEIDVDITLYYSNNSTVGYTYPNVIGIWVNDKFFSTYTLGKVAANVVHEWTHKLGYTHDFNRTSQRSYSVPYGVGSIVEELVDSL